MARPESLERGLIFDLSDLDREMRSEVAYGNNGHTARTLVRESDLRVVLVVMKAGARITEHRAQETASIHVTLGNVRLRLPDRVVELASGQLLALEKNLSHEVEAEVDSAFLLTLGWK